MQQAIHDILQLPVSFICFAYTVNLAVEKGSEVEQSVFSLPGLAVL